MVEYIMVWGAYEVMNYDSKALYEKYKKKIMWDIAGKERQCYFHFQSPIIYK